MAKDFKSPEDRRHLLDDYKQKIYVAHQIERLNEQYFGG